MRPRAPAPPFIKSAVAAAPPLAARPALSLTRRPLRGGGGGAGGRAPAGGGQRGGGGRRGGGKGPDRRWGGGTLRGRRPSDGAKGPPRSGDGGRSAREPRGEVGGSDGVRVATGPGGMVAEDADVEGSLQGNRARARMTVARWVQRCQGGRGRGRGRGGWGVPGVELGPTRTLSPVLRSPGDKAPSARRAGGSSNEGSR